MLGLLPSDGEMMARITVVNDNPEFLDLVRDILEDDRYEVTTVDGDRPDALDRVRASSPQVLMIDLRMGRDELHGWEIAQRVRAERALDDVPILVCSGDLQGMKEIADQLADTKNVATLTKPFSIDELTEAIEALLTNRIGS